MVRGGAVTTEPCILTLGKEFRDGLRGLVNSIEPVDDPARLCLELELAFSYDEFDALPMGPMLTDLLSAGVFRGTASSGARAYWRERLGFTIHRWNLVEDHRAGREPAVFWGGGRILVGLISRRSYHSRWVPWLVQNLGVDRTWVVSDDGGLRRALPPETLISRWSEVPPLEMDRWRAKYGGVAPCWWAKIRRLRERYGLSRTLEIRFRHALLVASQRVLRFGALLDRARPTAVLVEYDRNTRGAALVLAARRRGIPTFTLLHGVINGPFGYTPIVADTVFCWGTIQRSQLIKLGTPEERIRIVGFERLEEDPEGEGTGVRKRLGIPDGAVVVVLATNPIEELDRQKLTRIFCESVSRAAGIDGIVRLHPSETIDDYRKVANSFPGVRFTNNGDLSVEEVFELSDVIMVHSSGFGAEGMVKGIPCAVLDVLGSPLGHGLDLVRHADAPRLGGVSEIILFLMRFRDNEDYRKEMTRGAARFAAEMFAARGESACRNIAEAVLQGMRDQETDCGSPTKGEIEA